MGEGHTGTSTLSLELFYESKMISKLKTNEQKEYKWENVQEIMKKKTK